MMLARQPRSANIRTHMLPLACNSEILSEALCFRQPGSVHTQCTILSAVGSHHMVSNDSSDLAAHTHA